MSTQTAEDFFRTHSRYRRAADGTPEIDERYLNWLDEQRRQAEARAGQRPRQPIPDARATRELWPSEAVYQALLALRREDGRAALCVVLHLVDGEKQADVARLTALSQGQVSKLVARGLAFIVVLADVEEWDVRETLAWWGRVASD